MSSNLKYFCKSKIPKKHSTLLSIQNINNRKMSRAVLVVAQQITNPTSIHEDAGLIPQWVKDPALL